MAREGQPVHAKLVAVLFLSLLADGSSAYAASCSPQQAERADAAVDTITSWKTSAKVYRQFAACDDGSIAEGFSDAMAKIIIGQWKTLPQLNALSKADPGFGKFVLRHIDSTLDTDQLTAMGRLSARSCPAGAAALCKRIQLAAKNANK